MLTPVAQWADQAMRAHSSVMRAVLFLLLPRAGYVQFVQMYGYFRWADDVIDAPDRERACVDAFVARQRALVTRCLSGDAPQASELPEQALAEAAAVGRKHPRFVRAVEGMWSALEADAGRDSAPISPALLSAQIQRVGDAYTDALLACAGVRGAVPESLWLLARAATAAHHLRDLCLDLTLGYRNLPAADAERFGLSPWQFSPEELSPYVLARSALIHRSFVAGSQAISALPSWRTRLLFRLYTYRYRRLLRALQSAALLGGTRDLPRESSAAVSGARAVRAAQ